MENIRLSDRLTKTHLTARAFDDGDHWQDGKAFLPFVSLDASLQANQQAQMENSLETENIIGEVLDNEQNAVFGRETDWQIVPEENNEPQMKLAEEAEASAVDYWNQHDLTGKLKQANRRAGTQGKAVVRAFVPRGILTGQDKKKTLREAMNLIRFEVLPATTAGVFLDEEVYRRFGLLKKAKAEKTLTETTFTENERTFVKIIEETNWSALADNTLASLKSYMPTDTRTAIKETSFDLGGELLYFEIDRKPLITESIISNQKDVNLCLTMKNRLTYQAAYRDFFFFNAKPPVGKDGLPASIKTGGKSANFIAGEDVLDSSKQNVVGYASPSMHVIEPAPTENIIKSKEASAAAIYTQASQVHLTKNLSAAASGVSKRESRF